MPGPTPTSSPSPTTVATPAPTSTPSPTATVAPSPTPPPATGSALYCAVADVLTPVRDPARHTETALDRTYMLGPDYVPPDLVTEPARLRGIVATSLRGLLDEAAAAGHRLVVVSAYRSYEEQKAIFDHWVSVGGYDQALRTSARAGHSEHQLGTAVDLGDGVRPPWEYEDWGATPAGAWVAANAARFGFVMSYPRGKEEVTCYAYEPWHFRWVGPELADKVRASGLALREYQAR